MSDVDVVANFVVMTGATEDQAIHYLSTYNFNLEDAVVAFQVDNPHPSPPHTREDSPHYSSVDTGSPMSAPSPASHQVEGFAFPQAAQRPPTPPRQRALASSTAEAIQRLFARPDYVVGSDRATFDAECEKAASRHCWVVVSVVDNSFPCECFTRDIWASDAMRSLTSGSLFCYEINVTHTRGMALAEKYHVDNSNLPRMFMVDPVTQFKVQELPLISSEVWQFDSAVVVDAIMLFITNHDPPHDPFAGADDQPQNEGGGGDSAESASASASVKAPAVVDVDEGDSEAEMVSPPTISRSVAGAVASTTSTLEVGEPGPVVAPSPVTLDEYKVPEGTTGDASSVFRLRCRLPHSSSTLQLRPDTPVARLIDYLAYLLYAEDTTRYAVPPRISIFSGFPPKNMTAGEMEGITLSTWDGVRSGDVLMVRVNA
ncbi:UBX domain-containing protein [Leishmania donovani]|uniref:UBA-like domain family protein n=1 Tax=Leishmania donovani TaxID=5661 RepID=A0A504XQ94_LEIDO|nr:UBA-like domain family protein [Leishmania donovani]CAJ1990504.1 UBX domain-containing protein [Leishmania donovani]VDZ46359.1 UBX_domain-containing_protein/GeneDB:LmjF.29.0340 [Leishmania donovani]